MSTELTIIDGKQYVNIDGQAVAVIDESSPKATEVMTIREALTGFLVNTMSQDDLYNDLADVVGHAYIIAGYRPPDATEADIMINEIRSELRRNKTNLRRHELIIAVTNGVHEQYGTYQGLSVKSFVKFIYSYLKEAERIEELRIKNMRPVIKRPPTKEEQFQTSVNNALAAFEEFKRNGSTGSLGSPVYEFLTKYGVLCLDTPKKKEYYNLAIERVKSDAAFNMKNAKSKDEHSKFKDTLLKSFANAGNQGEIILTSKMLVVDNLFRGYLDKNIELIQVINDAREFYED